MFHLIHFFIRYSRVKNGQLHNYCNLNFMGVTNSEDDYMYLSLTAGVEKNNPMFQCI